MFVWKDIATFGFNCLSANGQVKTCSPRGVRDLRTHTHSTKCAHTTLHCVCVLRLFVCMRRVCLCAIPLALTEIRWTGISMETYRCFHVAKLWPTLFCTFLSKECFAPINTELCGERRMRAETQIWDNVQVHWTCYLVNVVDDQWSLTKLTHKNTTTRSFPGATHCTTTCTQGGHRVQATGTCLLSFKTSN